MGLCPRSGVLYISRTGSARASIVPELVLLPRISCGERRVFNHDAGQPRAGPRRARRGGRSGARAERGRARHGPGIVVKGGNVGFALEVEPSEAAAKEPLRQACEQAVLALPGVTSVTAVLTAERAPRGRARRRRQVRAGSPARARRAAARPAAGRRQARRCPGIRSVVAVASGKGGVGKSTTSVNLALGLARLGQRVGLLDADIYGPSQPRMLGITGKPTSPDGKKLRPMENYGVRVMSMGFLVDEDAPMIWRGPMVQSAIQQMLTDVEWGELDVLVVDLPPGTGDAQLTMAQRVPLAGAVIVSTPQDIALLDARKALNMFRKVDVPVLGIIENMSYFLCPHCGGRSEIFSHGGARATAAQVRRRLPRRDPARPRDPRADRRRPPAGGRRSRTAPRRAAYLDIARLVAGQARPAGGRRAASRSPRSSYEN